LTVEDNGIGLPNDFDITKIELPDIHFEIACSKGTYIRVIADDFGKELGCGGILSLLRRTEIGDYKVDDAYDLEELTAKFNLVQNQQED